MTSREEWSRKRALLVALFALPLPLISLSCGTDAPLEMISNGVQPKLSSIQQNVFTPTCAASSACHVGSAPQLGMDLSEGRAYTNSVNTPSVERPQLNRVTPGNATDSYLFMKITGDSRILGSRMPYLASPLRPEEIEAIRTWIENGAMND